MDTTTHRHTLDPATVDATGRSPGPLGEDLAVAHLVDVDGYRILARNWRLTSGELRGELDVVAEDPVTGALIVVEVKARRDAARFGGALAAVPPRKAAKVRALTAAFLRQTPPRHPRVRLDVIAVDLGADPQLTHVTAAL